MVVFISILLVLFIAYAILIDYYRRAWNRMPIFEKGATIPATPISVIIAARNEENNIPRLLASLEKQTYDRELFEVIVVDDHSQDRTWEILSAYCGSLRLTPLRLSQHLHETDTVAAHKKKAIETGIVKASGMLIVTTDADCHFPADWLMTLAKFHHLKKAKFVAAPVKIEARKSLLSVFQSIDFLTLQGITGASVYKRFHSMCNGANLAYDKSAFMEVDGFSGIDQIASGDDMLLMHKIFKKYPASVHYLKSREAIVSTEPVTSWKAFFNQRIRWASKAVYYDDKRIFYVLLLVYLLNAGLFALLVGAIINNGLVIFLLLFFVAKLLIEFPFVNSVATFFGQQRLMAYFVLLQPLHIVYTLVAGWLGKFGSFEWKGRVVQTT